LLYEIDVSAFEVRTDGDGVLFIHVEGVLIAFGVGIQATALINFHSGLYSYDKIIII
jgi:hypothetical protein